jgi:hypothetical protein
MSWPHVLPSGTEQIAAQYPKEEREAAAAEVATKGIEGRRGIAELLCRRRLSSRYT